MRNSVLLLPDSAFSETVCWKLSITVSSLSDVIEGADKSLSKKPEVEGSMKLLFQEEATIAEKNWQVKQKNYKWNLMVFAFKANLNRGIN